MENQQAAAAAASSAHRRINLIASHFAATDDSSSSFPNLLTVNCSSTGNFGTPRGDSRMYFARQGSSCQASFMRQVANDQGTLPLPEITMNSSPPPKGMTVTALNRLMYSRPATTERKYPSVEEVQPLTRDFPLYAPDPPTFAKPSSIVHEHNLGLCEQISVQTPDGTQWSPTMDVVETQSNYVVTVEVPGINIGDIRVEVNNENLVVMGKRANQWWNITSCSGDSLSMYHKKGITQGPYQVEWPLPADANRDTVSAQFVNGILQITIPKLQACRA
ncbi:unnamed protein product [Rhodiola kirilowii]